MIEVNVDRNRNGDIVAFSMSGHAEAGPYGYDIVCAGASAVSFGAVNAVSALCDVELDVDMQNDGGYLRCALNDAIQGRRREDVQLLLEGMVVSLESIAEEYGEHINILDA
ncbi:hypothetical protein SAMN05192534_11652 [Alteribacillus persepolensis]|uniref:Ribosomal processing cysteine protease Prp n=1 Tax=Alteribacillus persepolensis TaxID=568899 RepID=A0A1G8GMZ5_9BACI|nr:ribosomal-processing cysteine protease Prp [Alteribacillus persepolensis]SDH95754.1 hypothetical protein SAMN05192534_11652 [Alteribacillus persepolensis]